MKRINLSIQKQSTNGKIKLLILFGFLLVIILLLISTTSIIADDDDDDDEFEDVSKSLGWASVGLFAVSIIYIVFYQTFKLTRRISDESRLANFKTNYGSFFRRIQKLILYIHYISGLLALGVLLVHGILLTKDDTEAIIGWVTAGVYIFYILTGLVLWFKIIPPKRKPKFRKAVLYVHRSLLLFVIIIVIHIIHLTIAD